MTSILFNLPGKIEKPIVDALYLLKGIADSLGIPFFVVGAFFGPDAGDIGLKSLNVLIGLNASGKSNPVSRLPWYGLQKYHNRANIKIEMPLTPTLSGGERGIGG